MHLWKDSLGQEFLYKPAVKKGTMEQEPFRAEIQVAASKLQEIISPDTTVACELVENDGLKGTIQPKIKIDNEKTESLRRYYMGEGVLDEKIARQFMREYVVDYCLINYDSHYRNFIVDEKGNLRGVDKEQSFRYINDIEVKNDLKFNRYHPNARYGEQPPIYGKIFDDISAGKLSPQILEEVKIGIERLRKIPRGEYIDIFTPYAEALGYKDDKLATFYDRIMNRVDSLEKVEKMIEEMQQPKTSLKQLSRRLLDINVEELARKNPYIQKLKNKKSQDENLQDENLQKMKGKREGDYEKR